MGNLGREPEMRKTASGQSVCSFTVACSEKWTDKQGVKQEDTEWVNCTAWGKTAENICKFFGKGSEIFVEGKMKTRSWDDNGTTKYKTEVVVSEFTFTGGSKRGQPTENNQQQTGGESAPQLPIEDDMPF